MTHWKLPIRIIKSWSLQILTTRFALLKCTLSFVSSDPNVCSDVLSLCCLQLNIKLFSGWILPAPRALLKADSCHVSKKKKQKKKEKKKKNTSKREQKSTCRQIFWLWIILHEFYLKFASNTWIRNSVMTLLAVI